MNKNKEIKIKKLLSIIKVVFLLGLASLVIINTIVLCTLVPFVGYHLAPDNQTAAEMWEFVSTLMKMFLSIIFISIIAYGSVKIIQKTV